MPGSVCQHAGVKVLDRAVDAFDRGVAGARTRSGTFDHVWRAKDRFNDVLGGRLAAAISYYGFFAAFSLAVVAYSLLGRVVGSTSGGFIATVNNYLSQSLSWVVSTASQVGTGQITAIGTIALVLTGVAWVDALRSSTRAIWLLDQHPGHWIIRRLVDLGMLALLGLLLALSLATAGAIDSLVDHVAPGIGAVGQALLRGSGPVLEFLVNQVLAAALLLVVPRLRLSPRRLIPAALVVGIGIQLLNTIGRLYIDRTEHRPAYQLVTGAVGLLVYLYLLNQLILFGSAIAATAARGTVLDLAAGPASEPATAGGVGEPPGSGRPEPR